MSLLLLLWSVDDRPCCMLLNDGRCAALLLLAVALCDGDFDETQHSRGGLEEL